MPVAAAMLKSFTAAAVCFCLFSFSVFLKLMSNNDFYQPLSSSQQFGDAPVIIKSSNRTMQMASKQIDDVIHRRMHDKGRRRRGSVNDGNVAFALVAVGDNDKIRSKNPTLVRRCINSIRQNGGFEGNILLVTDAYCADKVRCFGVLFLRKICVFDCVLQHIIYHTIFISFYFRSLTWSMQTAR